VDRLLGFACGPSETAGPSATLARISCPGNPGPLSLFPVELGGVGELHAAFRNESSTRGCVRRRVAGNPGPVGMTKLRAVAHLGTSGGGWTESKKLI
jgi:hypothetical protein